MREGRTPLSYRLSNYVVPQLHRVVPFSSPALRKHRK